MTLFIVIFELSDTLVIFELSFIAFLAIRIKNGPGALSAAFVVGTVQLLGSERSQGEEAEQKKEDFIHDLEFCDKSNKFAVF